MLGLPGALRFFVPAAVARFGVAMSGLAVFWAVLGSSGSFAGAGAATGAFAVADAAAGPQVARLVDRWGQRRVVPFTAGLFAAAAVALVLARGSATAGVLLAALLGATAPPVGALSAARWRTLGGGTAALSLEAALNEVTFLIGPVLVSALSATRAPWAGLVLAVSLTALGLAGMLTARATEPAPGGRPRGAVVDRRLLTRPIAVLFAVNLTLGFFFGGIGVAITGFALAHGAGSLAGLITGAGGVVSLVAGIAYGNLRTAPPVATGASLLMTAGCAALALTPGVPAMFAGYAVVGGCVALVLIPAAVLLQQATPAEVYTQAMTWMNSASALGIATSAPLVGAVVEHHGWAAGFVVLAALTAGLPLALRYARS
ncbi:MFS transporter [Actinoplanes sp. NPDC051861]|uniref:MFS transporter n=1 Tax=Actinoplanes sp. NPDC051861 TaxID=3155170 RepID=UPI0034148C47